MLVRLAFEPFGIDIEINTIRVHVQVFEEVIRQCLRDVRSVQFQGHKHEAGEYEDPEIDLPDNGVFLAPGPPCGRVESVQILPVCTRLIVLGCLRVVEDGGRVAMASGL